MENQTFIALLYVKKIKLSVLMSVSRVRGQNVDLAVGR